jgi:transcription antitermination factor NusG
MPILPAEPDIFPETLLDGEPGPDRSAESWWVIYTLPRREKDLMRRLRAMQIAHYGPMIKHRSKSPSGRVRVSLLPLFPSYVFLCGNELSRHQALTTNCISRCIPVDDTLQLVRDLRQIRGLIQADKPLTPESKLVPGMRVRIKNGVLVGTEGTVVQRRGTSRLVIAVAFLQQGASVLIDDFEVEPIE